MLTNMKIIKRILIVILVCCFMQTYAQISVTPYVGFNWSKLADFRSPGDLKYTGDYEINLPIVSVEAKRKIHTKGNIGLTLSYRPSSFILVRDNSSTAFYTKIKYNLKYLNIAANYDLSVFRNLYLSTDIVFAYLIKASAHFNFHTLGGGRTDNTDVFPKRDFGIKLGVGYRYRKLDFRLKYYFGLNALDRDGKARMIQFDVGYRIIN